MSHNVPINNIIIWKTIRIAPTYYVNSITEVYWQNRLPAQSQIQPSNCKSFVLEHSMDPIIDSDWLGCKSEPVDESQHVGNIARSWQWRGMGINPPQGPSNKTVLENIAEDILVQKPLKTKVWIILTKKIILICTLLNLTFIYYTICLFSVLWLARLSSVHLFNGLQSRCVSDFIKLL